MISFYAFQFRMFWVELTLKEAGELFLFVLCESNMVIFLGGGGAQNFFLSRTQNHETVLIIVTIATIYSIVLQPSHLLSIAMSLELNRKSNKNWLVLPSAILLLLLLLTFYIIIFCFIFTSLYKHSLRNSEIKLTFIYLKCALKFLTV